jgi:hypothetical protein
MFLPSFYFYKESRMKSSTVWKNTIAILFASILLSACAIVPRVSSWDSPKQYSKAQVFNAALQAGGQHGYTATASDRESGTMSFTKKVGKGDLILSVQVTEANGRVGTRTTANFAGGLAIAGLHEEAIRNFHILLFRNLNITESSELNNVRTEELR